MRQPPASGLALAGDPEALARNAVEALRLAWDAHYEFPLRFRNDPNLRSLQTRSDLQLLLMDVAFPADAFTQ